MENNSTQGFIYAVQCDQTYQIKIGFTSKHLLKRLRCLQVGSASPLRLLGSWQGTREDESRVHYALREYRQRGEWFSPATIVLLYIANRNTVDNETLLRRSNVRILNDGSIAPTPTKQEAFERNIADLTAAKIAWMKYIFNQGRTCASIAQQYCVPTATIRDIISGKTWAHVPPKYT